MKVSIPIVALALLATHTLSGCAPKPKVLPAERAWTPTAQTRAPGGFSLQKRHGLGAWDKNAGPSERQLLKQLTVPRQPEKEHR